LDRVDAVTVAITFGAQNLSDAERLAYITAPLSLSGGSDSTMRRLLAESGAVTGG